MYSRYALDLFAERCVPSLDALARLIDGRLGSAGDEEHARDEHSTFTWLLEAMFERAGFAIDSAEYSDGGFDAKYSLRAT